MPNINIGLQSLCPCCGSIKKREQFYKSLIPDQDLVPFCNSCLRMKYKNYLKATQSEGAALWTLCLEVGYPMLREAYAKANKVAEEKKKEGVTPDPFALYQASLKQLRIDVQGGWQSDMMLTDLLDDVDKEIKQEEIKKAKRIQADNKEEELKWGVFDNPEDYEFLNMLYEKYTSDKTIDDTALELRYRDLCKAELRKRMADESGDVGEIDKALKAIKDLMAMLKLDKFDDNKISDEEKHIERLIWLIENQEPAECEDLEKYKDFSGFGKAFDDIMRCLKNLVAGTRDFPKLLKGDD